MSCTLLESQHLLEDDCSSDGIAAVCQLSEACPCKAQTTELGLARRQVLTRSCDFHYQRELQGAAGTYCTSDLAKPAEIPAGSIRRLITT